MPSARGAPSPETIRQEGESRTHGRFRHPFRRWTRYTFTVGL